MGRRERCEPHERTWRLQVRRKLRKREQNALRRALSWIEGLGSDDKERLIRGEELVLTVIDDVVGVIQLAAPRVPLDAELLTPEIPRCTHTEVIDESLPPNVVRRLTAHIHARATRRNLHEEAIHAER